MAGKAEDSNSHLFKAAVYNSTSDVPVSLSFDGVGSGSKAQLTVLTAPDALSMNEIGRENLVKREVHDLTAGDRGVFEFALPNLSVAVLRTG